MPPLVAGAARIRVTFAVDADGLLSVTALEQTSGVRAQVEVKPSYGLSDQEVTRLLRDSLLHADQDLAARRLREEQVEARRVMEALGSALASDGERLLSLEDWAAIEARLQEVAASAQGTDAPAIRRAIEELERACAAYVERRMNAGIQQVMAGHRLQEFDDPAQTPAQ
jgi:molecular chaperone HscA